LRLWEEDLPRFEVISQEQKAVARLPVMPQADTGATVLCLFPQQTVDQLTLPFTDQVLVEDDQPQLAFASVGADALW
jgi:hypothetical protein